MKTLTLKADTFQKYFAFRNADGKLAINLQDNPWYEIKIETHNPLLKDVDKIIVKTIAHAAHLFTDVEIHYRVDKHDDLTKKIVMTEVVFKAARHVKNFESMKMEEVHD